MKPSLNDFFTAHMEWLGLRPSLIPAERRAFARWLVRAHPELAVPYRSEPATFRLMCQEVQRGGRMPVVNGIGEKTLRRYAEPLAKRFLSLTQNGSFQDFLNEVLKQCPTERALKRYLATKTPPDPSLD